MGGLGKGGPNIYEKVNYQALEGALGEVEEIGEAAAAGRMSEDAFKAMSQVFKELGSNPGKAKGAAETIMFIKKQLDANPDARVVGIEFKELGTLKDKYREYDVVLELPGGKLQRIEIKAWNPSPKGVYNANYMGDMLFFSLRGKTHKKLSQKEIDELQGNGLSADELQEIVNDGGQLFEDLGQSLKKAINDKGRVDATKLSNIEHFWVFDGRVTPEIKADMVNRFIERLKGDKALFEVFKRQSLKGLNDDTIDRLKASQLETVIAAMIKTNT